MEAAGRSEAHGSRDRARPVIALFTGAGFSVAAGAPTMRGFLDAVRQSDLDDPTCRGVEAGYYFLGYTLGGNPDMERAYGAILYRSLVHGENFRVATRERGGRFVSSCEGVTLRESLQAFEAAIRHLYGERVERDQSRWVSLYRDFFGALLDRYRIGIVTTNYDRVAEIGLEAAGRQASYELRRWPQSGPPDLGHRIPVLKVHGSVNWEEELLVSQEHRDRITPDSPIAEHPYILPPTWAKSPNGLQPLLPVWGNAALMMAIADIVLIIGHSIPTTDAHLDYLLADGFSRTHERDEHKRVILVNPDCETVCAIGRNMSQYHFQPRIIYQVKLFEDFAQEVVHGLDLMGCA